LTRSSFSLDNLFTPPKKQVREGFPVLWGEVDLNQLGEMSMSTDQRRRVHEAVAECDARIAKELSYSERHRNAATIAFHAAHRERLLAMLEEA
jgi:hypothetical protein